MAKKKSYQGAELVLSTGAYRPTQVGLEVTGTATQSEWEDFGSKLKLLDEFKQWAIGDWLVDGKRHYGDKLYERAAALLGCDENTLRQYKSMAERFELLVRTNNLSWRHHYEVASIKTVDEPPDGKLKLSDEPDTQKQLDFLAIAERERLSVRELRLRVEAYKEQQREYIRLANEPEKYVVIYADPPWKYTSGDQHTDETQETVIGDHYPSMTIREICQLPVLQMASQDCVLFLWVTSPLLDESFEVIKAWGFDYKASMVWDKEAHNVGNYVSVRHEFLLICTRGDTPKVHKLADSVYTETRTEHSRKPTYFRDLIDTMYPNGKRVELFARGDTPAHWDSWGNEAT